MIDDDRPMLPMHENGVALYRTYRCLGTPPGSDVSPWQVALLDWWQFIGRRQAMRLLGDIRHGRVAAKSASSPESE